MVLWYRSYCEGVGSVLLVSGGRGRRQEEVQREGEITEEVWSQTDPRGQQGRTQQWWWLKRETV